METLNNLTTTATRAIWGDGATKQEEPVSGVTGDVSKGEPYDAGNIDHVGQKTESTTATATPSTNTATSATTSTPVTTSAPGATSTTGSSWSPAANTTSNDPTTGTTGATGASTTGASTTGTTGASTTDATTGTTGTAGTTGTTGATGTTPTTGATGTTTEPTTSDKTPHASEVKDSSVAAGDHTQAQNDTRSPDDPKTNPEAKETQTKKNVDNTTEGTDDNDNPVKVDGPGPAPINEIAKQYGGDAGNAPSSDSVDKKGKDTAGEQPEEDEDGPQKVSHGEGTGEQWVKSSGLKADGGDFDAAKPGAGREADRLLDQKGVHREENGVSGTPTDSNETTETTKTKTSLKDKIKAKLHKS